MTKLNQAQEMYFEIGIDNGVPICFCGNNGKHLVPEYLTVKRVLMFWVCDKCKEERERAKKS